jgi:murein DD-endopeptidase MepM/ murein hydrolase activator NlpD
MSGLLDPTPLAWQDPFLSGTNAPAATPGGPGSAAAAAVSSTPAAPGAPAATDPNAKAATAAATAKPKAIFPFTRPPTADFHTNPRYFRCPRGHGRLHAAVDLWAPHLTPIRAIADGTVIQAPYYFYLGTNALEVNHPGIGVVRYGEIDMKKVVHLKGGDKIKQGDIIAYVGLLTLNTTMLHFELYSGKEKGPLTVHTPPFQRRADLVNPTTFMEQLQKEAFGK